MHSRSSYKAICYTKKNTTHPISFKATNNRSRITRNDIKKMINLIIVKDTNLGRANCAANWVEDHIFLSIFLGLVRFYTAPGLPGLLLWLPQYLIMPDIAVGDEHCPVLSYILFMPTCRQRSQQGTCEKMK